MHTEELNVINAVKAWYRGVVGDLDGQDQAIRNERVKALPLPLRRLAQMMANLEQAERSGRLRRAEEDVMMTPSPPTPPTPPKKRKNHLRVVK